jgi:hypothetical protein
MRVVVTVWVVVTVDVAPGACGSVDVVCDCVDSACVVSGVVVLVRVESVGVVRVTDVRVATAEPLPPPHDVRATAARNPRIARPASLEAKTSLVGHAPRITSQIVGCRMNTSDQIYSAA